MFRFNFRYLYFLNCLILSIFLFGCKGKITTTAFDKLPDSEILSEVKISLSDKRPLVIAFTAEWCPHCRDYKPVFSEVKKSFTDKATFLNVDVDDKTISSVISRFQVRGIPTTAFIRQDGSVFKVQVGEIDKENLTKITNELLISKKKGKDEAVAPFPLEEPVVDKAKESAPAEDQQEQDQNLNQDQNTEKEPQAEEEVKDNDVSPDDSNSAVDSSNQAIEEEIPEEPNLNSGNPEEGTPDNPDLKPDNTEETGN